MRSSFLTVGALVLSALATPTPNLIQHEKRDGLPQGWKRTQKTPGHEIIPMRIALTQGNLDNGHQYLIDLSHPRSPNYGKHWSAKAVAEAFAPSPESVAVVVDWLQSSGVHPKRLSKSQSMGWLQFDASITEAEDLLKTQFYTHHHHSGKPHIAAESYHLPRARGAPR